MPNRPTIDRSDAEEIFRSRLIAARKSAGLTQVELAERLGEYQSFVSKVETGERRLSPVELLVLLAALNVDPVVFIRGLAQELAIGPGTRVKRRRKQ
jgi:transcriptional regulator with XRE-family HTH domain